MPVTIGSNIASLGAQRKLSESTNSLSKTFERLSSGQRINRASDDAAGLAIASGLDADTRVYTQAIRNVNDALSMLDVADGALRELSNLVTRQAELAEQAANGTYTLAQREALHDEANALTDEFNRIIQTTKFNGINILDTTQSRLNVQAGYGQNGVLSIQVGEELARVVGNGSFAARVSYVVGGNTPNDLQLADINGDGRLDIITAESSSDGLSVMLGNGNGTFKAASIYATNVTPISFTLVDMNGDSLLDAVTNDYGSGKISILMGNANGSFKAAISYVAGTNPRELQIGDYNGDGNRDVVIANIGQNSYSVLLGNANGTLSAATSFALSSAIMLTNADFNEDGLTDIATGNGTGVQTLLANGNGTFRVVAGPALGIAPYEAISGDFNEDGHADLITTNGSNTSFHIALGNGNGSFKAPISYAGASSAFNHISATDFNGDGIKDIVTVSASSARLSLGNVDGSFKVAQTVGTVTADVRNVQAGDFNGDGVPDFATVDGNAAPYTASIYLANTEDETTEARLYLLSQSGARDALTAASGTLQRISSELGLIGAQQARLISVASTLQSARENFQAAQSRIVDADVASESADLTRKSILQQVGSAVLAQANQQPQLALRLLQG